MSAEKQNISKPEAVSDTVTDRVQRADSPYQNRLEFSD